MKLRYVLSALLLSMTPIWALSGDMNQPELCIGSICLDRTSSTEQQLTKKLGPGKRAPDGHSITQCYSVPEQGATFRLGFDARDLHLRKVFVTKENMCSPRYQPKHPFQELVTTRGIRLGSDEAEVVRAYGEPSRIDDAVAREQRNPLYKGSELSSKYGTRVLVYLAKGNDLSAASFYLKNAKVYSILLSVEE